MNRRELGIVNRGAKRGFTLVEILIVVVLLGILAAIVVPQFSGMAAGARRSSTLEALRRIRTDIQLYKMQHDEALPAISGSNWTDLTTQKPNAKGVLCGPYMTTTPRNPMNNFSDVVTITGPDLTWGDPVAGVNIGFVFNTETGKVLATNSNGTLVFNEDNLDDPNN
jgi:general secretion pathway protein G